MARLLPRAIHAVFNERDFKKPNELALETYGLKNLPTFDFVDTRRYLVLPLVNAPIRGYYVM